MIFKWNGVPPVHIAGHQHSWAMHQSENSRKNCHFSIDLLYNSQYLYGHSGGE